jgi:enamine deaminase RidA (YjgF/YER057c/UK114 family)
VSDPPSSGSWLKSSIITLARSLVEVARIPRDGLFEIEAIAAV